MEPEPVIVDGDVLETNFEVNPNAYERFSSILLCSQNMEESHAVPYTYVRHLGDIVRRAMIRNVEDRTTVEGITWASVATADMVLVFVGTNIEPIYDMVRKLMEEIPTIHREIVAFSEMGLFNGAMRSAYKKRCKQHMRRIALSEYGGGGASWLPENYAEERAEGVDEASADAQRFRAQICAQIKHRPLPMTHILPLSDDEKNTMVSVLEFLGNSEGIRKLMAKTHYAQMLKDEFHALGTLMAEEFRCVKNELFIGPQSFFIFTDAHLTGALQIDSERMRDCLRYYVGDYLDELDLSHSYITGSAMSAVFMQGPSLAYLTYEAHTDLHYPPVYTALAERDARTLRAENVGTWNIRATSPSEGIATKNGVTIRFAISSGADVDIAVDNTVSDEQYRAIAAGHFATIKKYYPSVEMRDYTKPKGDWNYVIYTTDMNLLPYFRQVEIYRSSFRNICSHHVGAVRCAYTARWSDTPQFYCTASAMWTYRTRSTPNYHYFAGRKSNPQDIIIKYMMRGVNLSDKVLAELIGEYIGNHNIRIDKLPFYRARNVPYSLFAAVEEYSHTNDGERRAHGRAHGGVQPSPSVRPHQRGANGPVGPVGRI